MNLIPVALAATQAAAEESSVFPDLLGKIFFAAVAFVLAFVLASLLRGWVQKLIRRKQGDRHEEMVILYGRITFTVVLTIGLIIGLSIIGAPLEWFSGGVGLGVAFAMRSFIANFFAGLVLLTNSKFNLGDFVILNPDGSGKSDIRGTIVDIQSRATSLRAIDGGEITIPNLKMLESNVKCYTKNPVRRHEILISVGYQTNLREAADIAKNVLNSNPDVQPKPAPTVLVKTIAASAVTLGVRFWTESRTKWWVIKSELTREIFNTLQEKGIDIPYPVQTLRVDEASSDLLAENPHFLGKLEKIEKNKHKPDPKTDVFRQTPVESSTQVK
ncbi:MAG: mechanosensitive ion channel family protein [Patescibacteria group bacterium]